MGRGRDYLLFICLGFLGGFFLLQWYVSTHYTHTRLYRMHGSSKWIVTYDV